MKALKIALLSTTFIVGVSSAASAADIYPGERVYERSYKDEPVAYVAPLTWGGFYAGIHGGAGFGEDTIVDVIDDGGNDDPDDDILAFVDDDDTFWLAGLHAGYNWQRNGPWVFGIEGDVSFGDDLEYLASIRGRIGYSFNNVLVYATGGGAFLGIEDDFFGDDDLTGWVAGGGMEYKLAQNTSFGVEGLYYSFDEDDDLIGNDDEDFWVVRARLSYHFN